MPYQRLARHVLEEWRDIERRLLLLDPLSSEAAALLADAQALREEYQHLVALATAHQRAVPPPFPGEEHLGDQRGEEPDAALED